MRCWPRRCWQAAAEAEPTRRRVQAIRLRAGGGSACFSEAAADDEVKEDADDSDPVDLQIDQSTALPYSTVRSVGIPSIFAPFSIPFCWNQPWFTSRTY